MKTHPLFNYIFFTIMLGMMLFCNPTLAKASINDNKYYANVKDIHVYQQADTTSKALTGLMIGHEFRKAEAPVKAPSGWIYVEYNIPRDLRDFVGWVRKQDVVHYNSFKKVTRDWPVRYYCYWRYDSPVESKDSDQEFYRRIAAGTVVFEATFKRNGSASVTVFDNQVDWSGLFFSAGEDKQEKSDTNSYRGQMYRSGNVVMLKYGEDSIGFTYALDPKTSEFNGGESYMVTGQGAPTKESLKKAYYIVYSFKEKMELHPNVAKFCKHAPKP